MNTYKIVYLLGSFISLNSIGNTTCVQTKGEKVTRKAKYKVDDVILNRWSARAMSGEPVTDKELYSLFEAARWAQSSYNNQPWRFIYAKKGTKYWDTLFNLLVDFNKSWVKNAGALILVVSKNTFDFNGEFSRTHSFDTGAACENMSLQGTDNGLVVHGMQGFDYDKAKKELNIPDGYTVEAMFAVGKPGKIEDLPEELRGREVMSDRKPFSDFVFEGEFKEK